MLPLALASGAVYVGMVARGVKGWPRALKVVPALALAVGAPTPLLAAAFVLSAAGDALLLDKAYFLGGLGAFLVAHVLFVVAFLGMAPPSWPVLGLVGLAASGVLVKLWPKLRGTLRVAVPVYIAALATMAAAAAGLGPLGLAGGLVFVVSDSVLAYRQFGPGFKGADVAVMVTYYAALALLAVAVSG